MKNEDVDTKPDVDEMPKQAGAHDEAEQNAAKTSRLDRIRKKLKSIQGKNPDIYPMW